MRIIPCHTRAVPRQRTTGSSVGKSDGIALASLSACDERRHAMPANHVVDDDGSKRVMAC